jgi:hypothetical protein
MLNEVSLPIDVMCRFAALCVEILPFGQNDIVAAKVINADSVIFIDNHCHTERSEVSHREYNESSPCIEILPFGQNDIVAPLMIDAISAIFVDNPCHALLRRNGIANAITRPRTIQR